MHGRTRFGVRNRWLAGVLLAALGALSAPAVPGTLTVPAHAAGGLTRITGFGSTPGALNMDSYLPTDLPAGAPLVVALHGCTQNATDYFDHAGWPKYADRYGFALVFAEQNPANNANDCFTWFQPSDTSRGQGEALSIRQMVDYAVAHDGVDPHRVSVTGLSAGGAMTAVTHTLRRTGPDYYVLADGQC